MSKFIKLTIEGTKDSVHVNVSTIKYFSEAPYGSWLIFGYGGDHEFFNLKVRESPEDILMMIERKEKTLAQFPTDDRLYEGDERDLERVKKLAEIEAVEKPKYKSLASEPPPIEEERYF